MNKGVTIIELLLVIAIISTLGILSVSFYARFITQNEVLNTVDRLVGSFRKAQIYSMMGKENGAWGVKYTASPKTITLYLTEDSGFDETFSVNSNIAIVGFTDILFAKGTGLPNISGQTTITISGGNNSKTININNQGVVSR